MRGCPVKEGGQAIILALAVTVILFIISATSLAVNGNRVQSENYLKDKMQAYYYAEAGIERIRANMALDPDWVTDLQPNFPITFYFPESTVLVKKERRAGNDYLFLSSAGEYNQGRQTLEALIQLGEAPNLIFQAEKYPVLPD